MPDTTTQTNDQQLIADLQASYMDEEQKSVLVPLIPRMTDEEKAELITLIHESHQIQEQAKQAEDRYQEQLFKLNQQYEEKMNNIVREETTNARKEFEKIEHKEEEKELENIEDELNNL